MTLIVTPPPYTLLNGTIADATQVMADLLATIQQVNQNAAHNGVNSDITQLTGLTTALTPAQGGSIVFSGGITTGTANAQLCATTVPSGYTLTSGYGVMFQAGLSNGAAMTLGVNGTGPVAVKKYNSAGALLDVAAGDIVTGNWYLCNFDGTQYIVLNPTLSASGSIHGIPAGGSTNQVLAKNSSADYDVSWQTVSSGGVSGTSAFTGTFTSADTTFTNSVLVTIPHGLGVVPDFATCALVCQTNDAGYVAGQVLPVMAAAASQSGGRSFWFDATNLYFFHRVNEYGDIIATAGFRTVSAGLYNINAANWKVRMKAFVVGGGTASNSLVPLGKGAVDTSNSTALLDLRTFVTNDAYERIIIKIDNIVTTGGSGASNIYFEFAQQGTANSASNYGALPGLGLGSANFNQAPSSVCKVLQTGGPNFADGKGDLELFGFCSTSVKKWQAVNYNMIGYEDNATVTSRVGFSGLGETWGNGGDDTKVTDGLLWLVSGFTKATFDFQVFGLKKQ